MTLRERWRLLRGRCPVCRRKLIRRPEGYGDAVERMCHELHFVEILLVSPAATMGSVWVERYLHDKARAALDDWKETS